jgi:hypothetical protein
MELVPLGCHQRNAAKVAIRNFKAHFLSVLAGIADNFPPSLWDRLLPQTEITINLIRQSNATPTVLAYAHLSGPFDYNKMLLAPMGCEAQVHEKTNKRGTWAYHLVDGWYLFTSPEHYHTHNCHIRHTKSKQLSDTVQFQHKRITIIITHANKVMHALVDFIKALQGMTGSARNSQAAQDLQQIIDATQANIQAQSECFKDNATPSAKPHMQRVPRVQPPPSVPTPHINVNKWITRSMLTQTPVLRVPSNGSPTNKPTNRPTNSTKWECLRKRQAVQLQTAATPISTSPCIQTRAQVAMEAARVTPLP